STLLLSRPLPPLQPQLPLPQPLPPQPQPYPPQPQPYPPPQPQPYSPQPQPYNPYAPQPYVPPPPPVSSSDQPATLEMVGIGGALGLFGGLVIVDLRDIQDSGIATISVIGTTAAGGGLGYLLADRLEVNKGQAEFTMAGMLIGAANGALFAK